MLSKLQRGFLLLAALSFLGLSGVPVALVQVYGWATMLTRYAEQMPLSTALAYTFNGEDSCGYCAFVKDTKENNWQADHFQLQKELRLLPFQAPAKLIASHPPSLELRAGNLRPPCKHFEAPPGPPPRLA